MYEEYNNEKQTTKWFIGYFYLRRLLFSICCVYLINYPVFQIQLYMAFSLANLIFIILAKPFTTRKANYTEIYNELTVLAVATHLFTFTDFVPDASKRKEIGYSIIAIVLMNMMYHLLTIVGGNLIALFRLFKLLRNRLAVYLQKKEKTQIHNETSDDEREGR